MRLIVLSMVYYATKMPQSYYVFPPEKKVVILFQVALLTSVILRFTTVAV